MNNPNLPNTDSIQELARFWDTHDLTEFEGEMEEIREPVFERKLEITVPLNADEAKAIHDIAQARGMADAELLREWVLKHIHAA